MTTYQDYIKNKRVIFVGAAPIMIGIGEGPKIDSYDVVVRTNGSIWLIHQKDFQVDYGKRCDVLYTNNQFYREMRPLPVREFRQHGLKFLRMKTCRPSDFREYNHHVGTEIIRDAIHEVDKKISGATMGMYLIQDILNCNPESLMVTGIDFFISKKKVFEHDNYREYYPGYLPDKIREQGNRINAGKVEDGHNLHDANKIMFDLFKQGAIQFPQYIADLLKDIIDGNIKQQ